MRHRRRRIGPLQSWLDWLIPVGGLVLWAGLLIAGVLSYEKSHENVADMDAAQPQAVEAQRSDRSAQNSLQAQQHTAPAPATYTQHKRGQTNPPDESGVTVPPEHRQITYATDDAPQEANGTAEATLSADDKSPESTDSAAASNSASDIALLEVPIDAPAGTSSPHVARAQFATGIEEREPIDRVESVYHTKGKPFRTLYYFTEIVGMAGETATHVWEHEGEVIAAVPFDIGSNRWRTWSSKDLLSSMQGQWRVIVTDAEGNALMTDSFLYTDQSSYEKEFTGEGVR